MRATHWLPGPLAALAAGTAATAAGWRFEEVVVLALAVWMAVWWFTEALPLAVTALLPMIVAPAAGVAPAKWVAAGYAHEAIFLFFGGFVVAAALAEHGVDRWLAIQVLRRTRGAPRRLLAGILGLTAFLSAWISNTATAAMLVPVIMALLEAADAPDPRLERALLLAVAYGASIGGMATLVGSPPNLFLASFLADRGVEVSFATWSLGAAPAVAALLAGSWLLLGRGLPRTQLELALPTARLGPAGRRVLGIFTGTALAWLSRPLWARGPLAGVRDATIAVAAVLLLFLWPAGHSDRRRLATWTTVARIPWDVLLLLGGGLALARLIDRVGLAHTLAAPLAELTTHPWLLVAATVGAVVFFTELASNTATAVTLLPLVAELAPIPGDGVALAGAVALAASAAFMLPAATPPNAIVFAAGRIRVRQMARIGWWLNWLAIATLTLVARWWLPRLW